MKKKILKKMLSFVLMTALIISAVGCSSSTKTSSTSTKTPITIKFPAFQVGVNTGAPVLKKNIELFNEKYKGEINVVVEEIPGDQAYVDKMKILLSADDLPDLVFAGDYNLMGLALDSNIKLVDLTPYLDADPEWKECFTQTQLDYNSKDDKIYGLPESDSPVGYFYNKELFTKAGITAPAKTWDEFFTDCEKLKKAGVTPLSMDTFDTGWVTSLWLSSIVGTSGKAGNDFMSTLNVKDYNTPEFLNAVTKIQKMFLEYTTKDAIGGKYENAANNFQSGKTAMMANGPWMIPDFSDTTKSMKDFDKKVGAALYPGDGVISAPSRGYFIASKDKEHADATAKLLKFLTDKDAQLRALDMIGRIPTSSNIQISDEIKAKRPVLSELIELSKGAKYKYHNYQSIWYQNVLDRLSTDYPLLGAGKMTPQQFIQRLNEAAQKN